MVFDGLIEFSIFLGKGKKRHTVLFTVCLGNINSVQQKTDGRAILVMDDGHAWECFESYEFVTNKILLAIRGGE